VAGQEEGWVSSGLLVESIYVGVSFSGEKSAAVRERSPGMACGVVSSEVAYMVGWVEEPWMVGELSGVAIHGVDVEQGHGGCPADGMVVGMSMGGWGWQP